MASPTAPLLGSTGPAGKDVALTEAIFAAESSPTSCTRPCGPSATPSARARSRARAAAWSRAGARSPGARRAPVAPAPGRSGAGQFTGGGHIFAKAPRSFELKVNRKVARQAFRSALAAHVEAGSLALLDAGEFAQPSTRAASRLIEAAKLAGPVLVVLTEDEIVAAKSFRNLVQVAVVGPAELEVGAIVWARSLIVSQAALPIVEQRAG